MKKITLLIASFAISSLVLLCSTNAAFAQERGDKKPRKSPNASVSQTIGTTKITITYGRPGVNGRKIFGNLVPYQKTWRTGANESTNITFSGDVKIEGQTFKAGTYSLYTIPGKDQWTIILNSKLSWGTQYDKAKDVGRFSVKPQNADFTEHMMFYFTNLSKNSADAVLRWDKIKVPFTIKI